MRNINKRIMIREKYCKYSVMCFKKQSHASSDLEIPLAERISNETIANFYLRI